VFAATAARPITLHHFRTAGGVECDFLVQAAGRLLPIEVKASQTLGGRDAAGLEGFLDAFPAKEAPFGILLYPGASVIPLRERILAVPMSAFLAGHPGN
jgi:hypothetical protein